jgi:ligand-binding sensor domain-containing protein
MKYSIITSIVFCMFFSLFAAQRGETKVDSIVYDKGMEWKIFPSDKPVKAFAVQKNYLWFASETGLHSLNMVKGSEKKDFASIESIPGSSITCLAIDETGNLWIGTENGIALKTKDGFKIFTKDNGLVDNAVNVIVCVKNKVWVGTNDGACCYQSGSWTKYTTTDGLCGNKVRGIAIDNKNVIWFGTEKGISAFDGAKWTTHNMNNGLSWNDTKVIACDPKTNIIWAAVGEKDVNSYDGQTWKQYMEAVDGAIKCIMTDSQSRIWLGTSGGLVKFNGEEWVTDKDKIGIPAEHASQMYRDDHGNLWFGMEKGVMRVDNPYPY